VFVNQYLTTYTLHLIQVVSKLFCESSLLEKWIVESSKLKIISNIGQQFTFFNGTIAYKLLRYRPTWKSCSVREKKRKFAKLFLEPLSRVNLKPVALLFNAGCNEQAFSRKLWKKIGADSSFRFRHKRKKRTFNSENERHRAEACATRITG